ncbi:rhodanese-like domain-containing protein [uncultured Hyphomonas sp.]|jgi:rhodanese-related sulfurtransferase|uniref:rhodanese-like domain-containing protein n=1 Tax=uncultured Hyphomonas sp. TaxID=225298 RepID=UPI002AAB8761|nr:rhodanese-like domain-containing protein [uncultured Hyphomonas sp.]
MGLFDKLFGGSKPGIPQIDPADANDRVRKKQLILVDVRTENEWQGGIPKGAHTVTLGDPRMVDTIYGFMKEDASAPVAVICRSGMRSGRAAKLLAGAGFTDVSNVRGGMMAWTAANLPVKQYRK